MTAELVFQTVAIRSLRNIAAIDFQPAPRLNVISGDNGQGKTSLLEALYLVATSASFRTDRLRELIQDAQPQAAVRAQISEAGQQREQRAVVSPTRRDLRIDGKPPARILSYAIRTPVVVFHPGDLTLVAGPPAQRRILLSRQALFSVPGAADHRQRYRRALRERQRLLDERGPTAVGLDAYEQLLVEHGTALSVAHRSSAHHLLQALHEHFSRMAPAQTRLETSYLPGGSEDPEEYTAALRAARPHDQRRRTATFGPHRDDLKLALDGRSARQHASQGQQRLLTLALKLAELACVREARGAHPVLLLDDVSSELDPDRTGAVYDVLRDTPSQVFITTTRPDLLVTPELSPGDRTDWVLCAGALQQGE